MSSRLSLPLLMLCAVALVARTAAAAAEAASTLQAKNPSPASDASPSPAPSHTVPSQDVFPFPFHIDDLDNGLRVVTVQTDFGDLVSLHIVVATGSRNEVEDGRSGFAHFFEHMMFRGSKNYSADRRNQVMQQLGVDGNAYTTNDYTNYHETFGRDQLDRVLEVEADRFLHLKYERPAFRTEAMAVFGEYNKNSSSPINKLYEVLQDTAFDRHTYKHTTMGFLRDIVKMPQMYDYSLEFFDRWYRPEYTTIMVVGDVQPQQVGAMVRRHFGAWQRGSHKAAIPAEPPQAAPRHAHVPWSSPTQPWVAIAFKGPAFSAANRDQAALDLVAELAFGPDSPLYRQLVVNERKATALLADFGDSTDPFLDVIFVRVQDPADATYVRDAVLRTCEALKTTPFDAAQLDRVKRHLRYRFAASLDSADAVARAVVSYLARTRTPATVNDLYARYAEVDSTDIMRVARTYFDTKGRTIGTVAHGDAPLFAPAPDDTATPCDAVLLPTKSPLVTFRLVFLCGAADDPSGKQGLAQMTAQMLAQGGTESMTFEEVTEALFPMAASFDAQVDKQMTTLSATVHQDNLEPFWTILREALTRPGFREDDLARLKLLTKSYLEVELRGNNDEELGKEVLYGEIYRGHPFAHHNAGNLADVEALTLDDVRAFYRDHLRADRLVVGLAGGYPDDFADRVRRELSARLGGDPGKPAEPAAPPVPKELARSAMTIVQKKTLATGIHLGFPIEVTRRHPDFVALWLVRSFLGEHRNSAGQLYQRLREVRGLNYGDYAYIEYFPRGMFQFKPDPNLARTQQIFQLWIRPVPPQNAAFACRAALYYLHRLVEQGLTEAEFETTRQFLRQFVATFVATQDARLGYALDSSFYGSGDFVEQIRSGLASLTVADVNRAIKQHLHTDRVQFVVVTEDADAFVTAVLGERSPITYQAQPAAEVLEEDKTIERFPLGVRREDVRVVPVAEVFAK
ncbi:MAG: pitrilysin family protein [Planctomycetota bacterium]